MEPKYEQETAPEARESEFIEEFGRYVVELKRDGKLQGWVRITPTQGLFDVEVVKTGYTNYEDEYTGEIRRGLCVEEYSKTRELTVEDVQTALDPFGIKLPDSVAKELSDWRQEFWESPEMKDEMHMAAAEAGDLDGQLTPEEVEMIYGPEERLRLFGSSLTEAQGIADYESSQVAVDDSDASARRGYSMEEWERMVNRELDRRNEFGLDFMEAEGIRRAELELRREQKSPALEAGDFDKLTPEEIQDITERAREFDD